MSLADFKNWLCPLSLSFKFSCRFLNCPMSPVVLRNANVTSHDLWNSPVDFKIVQCRLSDLRNDRVALSNLRVRVPILAFAIKMSPFNTGMHIQ